MLEGGCCGILANAACEPMEVIGLEPLTGGAGSLLRLALAAAIDLELLIIIYFKYTLFLNYLRISIN
jgi:hypothetical protein